MFVAVSEFTSCFKTSQSLSAFVVVNYRDRTLEGRTEGGGCVSGGRDLQRQRVVFCIEESMPIQMWGPLLAAGWGPNLYTEVFEG